MKDRKIAKTARAIRRPGCFFFRPPFPRTGIYSHLTAPNALDSHHSVPNFLPTLKSEPPRFPLQPGSLQMTHQPKSMHDTNRQEAREHKQWIDMLEKWRIEHKQALAKLTKMQAALMEHDAEIEAQLAQIRRHDLFIEHEEKRSASKTNGQSHPTAPNPHGEQ